MKQYPSINKSCNAPNDICHIFVKYDGSNIRAEWSKKRGWYKFGTRKRLLDEKDTTFGSAITLFQQKYADDLSKIFKKDKIFRSCDNIIVFYEWYGAKSFSCLQYDYDPKNVVLFDVNPIKKGLLSPKEFLDIFGHLEVAELLDVRKFNNLLIQEVREGILDCRSKFLIANQISEGVVCKGGSGHKLWMAKIKTNEYLNKLKELFKDNWEQFWE